MKRLLELKNTYFSGGHHWRFHYSRNQSNPLHIHNQTRSHSKSRAGRGPTRPRAHTFWCLMLVYVSLSLHVIRLFWSKSDVPQPLRSLVGFFPPFPLLLLSHCASCAWKPTEHTWGWASSFKLSTQSRAVTLWVMLVGGGQHMWCTQMSQSLPLVGQEIVMGVWKGK